MNCLCILWQEGYSRFLKQMKNKKSTCTTLLGQIMNKGVSALVCKQGYVFVQNNSQVKIKFNLVWLSPYTKKIENPAKLS